MKTELKQLFFLSLFCFLCTAFVFFVPWGSSQKDDSDELISQVVDGTYESETQEYIQFTGVLRVAVNEWMLDSDIASFAENFKSVYWWNIEFIEVDSPNKWQSLKWIDLYIIPYDVTSWLQFQDIPFQEDISNLFIPQLKKFVLSHGGLIPFWVDLPIMYWMSNLLEWNDWLVYSASNWKPVRPHWPFNFWISDNIATYDNSLISSQQIIDFIDVNDVWAFSQWIDFTASSQELQQWLLTSIQSSSDVCKEYPLACLLEKNLLWVAWWFKSDYDKSFENEFTEKWYPYEGKLPFVRLYTLGVAKDSENLAMAYQFILDYMDKAFSEEWRSLAQSVWLVPVFLNEYQSLCYQDACGLKSNFNILEDGFSKIERFYKDSVFWKVLWKKIQPNLYLVNTLL